MNNTGTKNKGMRLKSKLAMVYILAYRSYFVCKLFPDAFCIQKSGNEYLV